jgi:hypothetical protein
MPIAEAVEQVQNFQREWAFCLLLLSRSVQLPLHQRILANRVAEPHAKVTFKFFVLVAHFNGARYFFFFGVLGVGLHCRNKLNTFEPEVTTNHFRLLRPNGSSHSPNLGSPPPVDEDVEVLHRQTSLVV